MIVISLRYRHLMSSVPDCVLQMTASRSGSVCFERDRWLCGIDVHSCVYGGYTLGF